MLPPNSDQFFFPRFVFAIINNTGSRIKWVRPTFYLTEELTGEDGSTYRQLYASLCLIAETRTGIQPGWASMETRLCDSFSRVVGRNIIEENPTEHFVSNVPSDFDVMRKLVTSDIEELDDSWRELGLLTDKRRLFCFAPIGELPQQAPLSFVLQYIVMNNFMKL
jgi:hypothetical protein